MSDQAKIVIVRDGTTIEISGSEAFVREQITTFKDVVTQAFESRNEHAETKINSRVSTSSPNDGQPNEELRFDNLLHIEGEVVRILKKVSGNSKAELTVRTALIYLLGKELSGVNSAPASEIRQVCEELGCLDSSNFASYLKGAKQWVLADGKKGGNKIYRLTVPGREKAMEIAKLENGS